MVTSCRNRTVWKRKIGQNRLFNARRHCFIQGSHQTVISNFILWRNTESRKDELYRINTTSLTNKVWNFFYSWFHYCLSQHACFSANYEWFEQLDHLELEFSAPNDRIKLPSKKRKKTWLFTDTKKTSLIKWKEVNALINCRNLYYDN